MKITICTFMFLTLVVTACTSIITPKYIGTYNLVSINGEKLPFLNIQSGTLTLNADHTCKSVSSTKVVFSTGGLESEKTFETSQHCTYTVSGDTFTFTWKGEGSGTTSGVLDGDTLSVEAIGIPFIYER
jgi:hypothetical protein